MKKDNLTNPIEEIKKNFKTWIDKKEWFYLALKNNLIYYWDFNLFLFFL